MARATNRAGRLGAEACRGRKLGFHDRRATAFNTPHYFLKGVGGHARRLRPRPQRPCDMAIRERGETGRHGGGARRPAPVAELLSRWQATGDHDTFGALYQAIYPTVMSMARAELRRHGCLSPASVDEVLSLVLEHVRRLHAASPTERSVAVFAARQSAQGDPGERYVVWLTRARSRDVLRRDRRRSRRLVTFSALRQGRDVSTSRANGFTTAESATSVADGDPSRLRIVRLALEGLDAQSRQVVEWTLAGRPRHEIAQALGVCAGTVCRRLQRSIERLRGCCEPAVAPRRRRSAR